MPQNPTTALNPGMRVGAQIAETLSCSRTAQGDAAAARRASPNSSIWSASRDPPDFAQRYPHQLSGGQQQRVCIAMALACDPNLVVLDEPTTGLDVTTQEQIVALLVDLRARLACRCSTSPTISALLSQIADRIGVMYAGHLVETGRDGGSLRRSAPSLYAGSHRLACRASTDPTGRPSRPLRGLLQRQSNCRQGCPFAPRCDCALPRCLEDGKLLRPMAPAAQDRLLALATRSGRRRRRKRRCRQPLPAALRSALLEIDGRLGRLWAAVSAASRRVARRLSLEIRTGETVALVGESGSGKSTVARAISGTSAAGDRYRSASTGSPLAPRVTSAVRRSSAA